MPKDMVMQKLLKDLGVSGENVLVIGDGRAEIHAGVQMGAFVVSRLPENADFQRELHRKLGTNIIIKDFFDKDFLSLCKGE
jgi:beta-phosphoglucomutase-like phosphatase (HAD superfamily)